MVCLAGIDVGTTGTKVTIYNEEGTKIDSSYTEYSLSSPQPHWVEIDPNIWWRAVCNSFKEIFSRKLVMSEDIKGISISSTNGLVLLNNTGIPIRPAIMQLDQRAAQYIEKIKMDLGEGTVEQITKNRVASGAFWGPTLLWLLQEEKIAYRTATYFLTPHSYIVYKLTGAYTIDHSRASTTMLYNPESGTWDSDLCSYFDMKINVLPSIHESTDIVGDISNEAAKLTGLKKGTAVTAGCMDSVSGHIGIGTVDKSASLILGSVGRICFHTQQLDLRFMNVRTLGAKMFSMTPTNAAGISYKWLKDLLFEDNHNKNTYKIMDQIGERSPVGAKGLIYHPYLAGERSPIWNPIATGSFFGLTKEHKKEDLIRSVLEGVGYSIAHNYKMIKEDLRHNFECFHASGGGAKSKTWLQILSHILGVPVKVPINSDSETLGNAILAGVAVGVYSSVEEGITRTVKFKETFYPDLNKFELYQRFLELYIEMYDKNKSMYEKIQNLKKNIDISRNVD